MNVLGFLGIACDERLVSKLPPAPRNLPDLPTIEEKETIYQRVHFHLNPFCQKISSLEIEFQVRRPFPSRREATVEDEQQSSTPFWHKMAPRKIAKFAV